MMSLPGVADALARGAAQALGGWAVRQIRLVPLLGVDDGQLPAAEGFEEALGGGDNGAQAVDVIAEGGAEAAGLDEIALHVDDDQGHAAQGDDEVGRFCGDAGHAGVPSAAAACGVSTVPAMWRPMMEISASAAGVS